MLPKDAGEVQPRLCRVAVGRGQLVQSRKVQAACEQVTEDHRIHPGGRGACGADKGGVGVGRSQLLGTGVKGRVGEGVGLCERFGVARQEGRIVLAVPVIAEVLGPCLASCEDSNTATLSVFIGTGNVAGENPLALAWVPRMHDSKPDALRRHLEGGSACARQPNVEDVALGRWRHVGNRWIDATHAQSDLMSTAT